MPVSDIPTRRIGIYGIVAVMVAMVTTAGISDINQNVICETVVTDSDLTAKECYRQSQLMKVIESQVFIAMGIALAGFIGLDKIDNMVVTRRIASSTFGEPSSEVTDVT